MNYVSDFQGGETLRNWLKLQIQLNFNELAGLAVKSHCFMIKIAVTEMCFFFEKWCILVKGNKNKRSEFCSIELKEADYTVRKQPVLHETDEPISICLYRHNTRFEVQGVSNMMDNIDIIGVRA